MAIENFQCAMHFLLSVIGLTMVELGEQIVQLKVLRRLENVILRLVFANAVYFKR